MRRDFCREVAGKTLPLFSESRADAGFIETEPCVDAGFPLGLDSPEEGAIEGS